MVSVVMCGEFIFALTFTLSITPAATRALEQEDEMPIRIISYDQNKIYGVSEFFDTAMFVFPQLEKIQNSENLVEYEKWDDWLVRDSSNITSNVEDKRWEDFYINETNYLRFPEPVSSISFSVYGTEAIKFFADDEESLDYFEHSIDSKEWTTFTIFFKDNNVHYVMDNNLFRKYNLRPTQVVVSTAESASFKIHKYKYREATTVTNDKQNPTSLTIPPSNKTALIVFSSLCKSCVLEVEHGGTRLNISSHNKETHVLEQWGTDKITLNSSVINTVNFIRKKNNQTEEGFWKLDVRLYENENSTVVYKINKTIDKPEDTYVFRYLHTSKNSTQRRMKRNINPTGDFAHRTDCRPGMVGPNCDISCKSVLGQQFPQCEEHKICIAKKCHCAWGYRGSHCQKKCDDGFWGIDCRQTCDECQVCDKITGKCNKKVAEYNKVHKETVFIGGNIRNIMFWCNEVLFMILLTVVAFEGRRRLIPLSNRTSTETPNTESSISIDAAENQVNENIELDMITPNTQLYTE